MTYIHAHQIPDMRLTATKTKNQVRNRQAEKKENHQRLGGNILTQGKQRTNPAILIES